MRLPARGAFAEGTGQPFAGTPLPAVTVRLFGLVLPVLETAIGLFVTGGLWTRGALLFAPGMAIITDAFPAA